MRRFGSALALSLVLVLGLAAVQAQEVQVGVTAAVNPGATDKAEGTGDIDETSQLIVTEEIAGGITISGTLGGRIKHATNPLLGTDDTSPSFNLAFAGAPSRTAFSTSRSRAASRHRLRPGASRSQRPSSPSARAS